MRIVSGTHRGRNLDVPDNADTRPTMDRTRQAVFNILRSASWAMGANGAPRLQDAHVLDIFAGSGAMGFEAMSQGAAQAVFFEKHADAIKAIESNTTKMKLDDAVRIIKGDITAIPANTKTAAQIAFLDPPYHQGLIATALKLLRERNWIDTETLLVLEMHKTESIDGAQVNVVDTRNYGVSKMVFGFLQT